MVSKIKILGFNLEFCFRYKNDKLDKNKLISEFKTYNIGFWFRKERIVDMRYKQKGKKFGELMINHYMFGCDLLLCKLWFTIDYRVNCNLIKNLT
jgi:hypothetical protein